MGGLIKPQLFLIVVIVLNYVTNAYTSKIYYFVDERGVYHFTDIPDNKKYKPFIIWDKSLSKKDIRETVEKISRRYNVDPDLIMAIIKVESNFDYNAISPKNAQGLMQLAPITQIEVGLKDPYDPYGNIEAGIRYFKYLLEKYNRDLKLSLAAYNAGPTTVDKYKGVPPYRETRNYVKKVIKYYKQLKKSSFESVKLAQ